MEHEAAAQIVALRPALESLIVKATSDPESVENPDQLDADLTNAIRALSASNAGKFGIHKRESQE